MVIEVGDNTIIWGSHKLDCIPEMLKEHFLQNYHNSLFVISTHGVDVEYINKFRNCGGNVIYYNLEHRYPIMDPSTGNPTMSMIKYEKEYFGIFDELWDFQIENKQYYHILGYDNKFKFIPLRYTTWFEHFITNDPPKYMLEFEATFHTKKRQDLIKIISTNPYVEWAGSYKIANHIDVNIKYHEKQDAKFNLDIPQLDFPETINTFRIYESICLNKQCIVYDEYKCGTRRYFDDLCIYLENFTPEILWSTTLQIPRTDVSIKFKEMTFEDHCYKQYIYDIINDFDKKSHAK